MRSFSAALSGMRSSFFSSCVEAVTSVSEPGPDTEVRDDGLESGVGVER